jgi:hypothetical protein
MIGSSITTLGTQSTLPPLAMAWERMTMSNVIYPMSLIAPYRRKADQWRRHASLTHQCRFVQIAETYDTLADHIERVGRRWVSNSVRKATRSEREARNAKMID